MLVTSTNIDANFWEANSPELKYTKPFVDYYRKDRSRDKLFSSQQMWAVFMYVDPRSRKARLSDEERREEIIAYYLTPKHKWEDLEELISAYPEACLSKIQRLFRGWIDKMTERDGFIMSTDYDENTFEMLDKMMGASKRMWEQLNDIKSAMIDEELKNAVFGGRRESKSELGEL